MASNMTISNAHMHIKEVTVTLHNIRTTYTPTVLEIIGIKPTVQQNTISSSACEQQQTPL